MGDIIEKCKIKHNLQNRNNMVIPHFNTYVMTNSIRYRGTVIIWNILTPVIESSDSSNIGMYARGSWKSQAPKELSFISESPLVTQ